MRVLEDYFVSLQVSGPGTDPEKLTHELGIAPTMSSVDPEIAKLRPIEPFWTLETRDVVRSSTLADHLTWLADRLEGCTLLVSFALTSKVELCVNGHPDTWALNQEQDELLRSRIGLPMCFVVSRTVHREGRDS